MVVPSSKNTHPQRNTKVPSSQTVNLLMSWSGLAHGGYYIPWQIKDPTNPKIIPPQASAPCGSPRDNNQKCPLWQWDSYTPLKAASLLYNNNSNSTSMNHLQPASLVKTQINISLLSLKCSQYKVAWITHCASIKLKAWLLRQPIGREGTNRRWSSFPQWHNSSMPITRNQQKKNFWKLCEMLTPILRNYSERNFCKHFQTSTHRHWDLELWLLNNF